MLSVAEARARILDGLRPTGAEIVSLAEAAGRVTHAAVRARLSHPPRDVSAMDGYAVRAAEAWAGAVLRIVGEAAAGHPWSGTLPTGAALRLFTGSALPDGADTVLIQENARRDGDAISVLQAPALGRHIREAGQDFRAADVLVAAGVRLGARAVGLAAAGDHAWLAVHRRPVVAILATGDEICLPGEPIRPGGIVGSNGPALAAFVVACGGTPVLLPIVGDDTEALAAALGSAPGADLLLTTGGASVGDHDLVRPALQRLGATLDFWKVAMRPGKPLMHGWLSGQPVIGLPGNPVSALVTALLFGRPAIQALSGLRPEEPAEEPASCGTDLPACGDRADYLRATLSRDPAGRLLATPLPRQDSGMLRALADADALIVRARDSPTLPAGAVVQVILLAPLGL